VEGKLMAPSEIRLRLPASFEPKPAVPAPNELPLPITPFTGSLLTPDDGTAARSEQLEAIAQQADRQICHGYELANRGALFAARGEFVAALRLVAQGLDSERQTSIHSRALSAGLTALREVQDFLPAGSKVEAELDLPTIIVSHRTPVLKGGAEDVRPLAALRCYFTFAQEQLAAAEGREVAGSIALCALGKLHAALARQKRLEIQAPEPKAVAYFQAALLVCPRNSLASHELGVLLAQCGNPANARPMLEHSVGLCRTATGLRNLAVVYQQLGLARQASETLQQSELARQAETARMKALRTSADGMVQWVDQDLLARSGSLPADLPPPGAKPNPSAPAANTAASPKKPIVGWLPWSQEKR
jgi:tetratricopeptide (TPR) repeat protein